jgi:nickel/cobalt transporter (NicO) family protein
MSASGPALIVAAAGVGFGHAILPDHWVPLAVLGRTRRYPLSRVARLSGLAGVAHVLVSIVLGGIIIAVGLQFRSSVQSAQDTIIGCILIATGIGFAVLEATGRGHGHSHDHGHHHHGHGDSHGHDEHDHDHADQDHADHDHADHDHDHANHDHDHADHDHDHAEHVLGHLDHDQAEHSHGSDPGRLQGIAAVMVPFGAAASPDLTILPVFLAATTAGVGVAVGSLVIFATVTIGTIVGLTLAATRGGYEIRGQWLERWGNLFTALVLIVIGGLVLAGVI